MNIKNERHDEMHRIKIQEHTVKLANTTGKYLFLTPEETIQNSDLMDEANGAGKKTIYITENLRSKIHGGVDVKGNKINDLFNFSNEYKNSFKYNFIDPIN